MSFDYELNFTKIDFAEDPYLYRVGKGEQGVLLVRPYKDELLPLWRFKTPKIAQESARKLYQEFLRYRKEEDFVGMDMARKYIQMGFTRSRRYANHRSGKKYDGPVPANKKGQSGAHGREILPIVEDSLKAESALIFKKYLNKVESDKKYQKMKDMWKLWYG